ncbi:MAG: polyprenyl diphosphate synthase [Calditrichaceae bacterium]|jgi:undecaprenyl diphosphate synthase
MGKNISELNKEKKFHVAIIMDGNGRWANSQGKPRFFGHRAGAENLRSIVETCPHLGITTLTAYAFSSDNWGRPTQEVKMLMRLFNTYLQTEIKNLIKNDVKLNFIGRRDRFDSNILNKMEIAEEATAEGRRLNLRLAVDYSARDMLIAAAKKLGNLQPNRQNFAKALADVQHGEKNTPDVDLLIRTGGEQRLSDFLLWECAYAEFFFSPAMWPDFNPDYLRMAVDDFKHRDRRFGCVPKIAKVS